MADEPRKLTNNEVFEVVHAFSMALASTVAMIDDLSPARRTSGGLRTMVNELRSDTADLLAPEQVKLFDQLLDMWNADVVKAIENRELRKRPH